MKKTLQRIPALCAMCMLLVSCALPRPESATLYDLGPARPMTGAPALPAISVADVTAPGWLDRPLMFYRLNYQSDLQPRAYTQSRWMTPPTQMVTQRVKTRIAQAGGVVLPASDGAANMPLLRIEADDFMQVFDVPGKSVGRVTLRASLFRGRVLVAQQSFSSQVPAASADAGGGARALAAASDMAIADIMRWLAALPQRQGDAMGRPAGAP
ncbi:ABC-type transport auxiliary lipoprotein family protein [Noviherbaspirillum sp. UKPF54]|uniref:ABC-type transport auxiliary lipoprotein family protein n=1 Tax=Noviherbaspirillum sp. UKPF54 TaxID=2601898 RepID=UPI0011B16A60|nr:ABC-type transport auxiliary lipoprotein family protein [Noviherbaspirillum sp. UKPF54]QDZ29177.1 ABC transporter [Noviherbaspirillum sp. UKPF54]